MFKVVEKWELLNGEFMTLKNMICWLILIWINCFWINHVSAAVSYSIIETAPEEVEVSGIFRPEDGSKINGTYSVLIDFFSENEDVPTVSYTEDITITDNYFRFNLYVLEALETMLYQVESLYVSIYLDEDVNAILPIATTPYTVKSSYGEEGAFSYDEDVFAIDYENYRIGIGTANPQEMLSVSGTVNVSEFFFADGSELVEIGYRGGHNYNFLNSADGQFTAVVTVNVDGKVMIGGTSTDSPIAKLHVFGSLLIDDSNPYDNNMVTGMGSRFMWYSEKNMLRIGYVSSYYWDDEFSGDFSIGFGHSTIAQGDYSVVAGGFYNQALADYSIISGGYENIVSQNNSIILGGQKNYTDAENAVVLGGFNNQSGEYSIVLGGQSNTISGKHSIASGEDNKVYGDGSVVIGGTDNRIYSDDSMIFGSYAVTNHDNSILFNFTESDHETAHENHIQIFSESGMGINTTETFSDGVNVAGKVWADKLIGDGTYITNVLSENSLWESVPGSSDSLFLETMNIGVQTTDLVESLNVSGSIYLNGEGNSTLGTLRYYEDDYEIYTSSGWHSLTIEDTNTEYFAKDDIAFFIEDNDNKFVIATENAITGQSLKWTGNSWEPSGLDQFLEDPLDVYINDLLKTKRLYLSSGYVSVGTSNTTINDFTVVSDKNTAAFLYHDPINTDVISISVNPVGFHFQAFYNDYSLQLKNENVAGQELIDDRFVYYVSDNIGRSDIFSLSQSQILIGSNIDTLDDNVQYSFYVDETFGTDSFIFGTDLNGVSIRLKEYYDLDDNNSIVLYQEDTGELYIQSGPGEYSGDIRFQQSGQQIAKLSQISTGETYFGLSKSYIRAGFDVFLGNVHVTDTYGVGFYFGDEKKSEIKFDSSNTDQSIQFFTSNNFSTANLSISEEGNVAINAVPNPNYDFLVQNPDGVDTTLELFTDENVPATLEFQYDYGADGVISDASEQYSFYLDYDFMGFSDYHGTQIMSFTQDKFVGFFDTEPHVALSINEDIVLSNQHSVYFKQSDQVTSIPAIKGGDIPTIYSTDDISFKTLRDITAINMNQDGLAINEFKFDLAIDGYEIDFEVSGSVMVDGDIYDQNGDKIFPLLVRNLDNTKREPTVNVININTDSGLILNNSGFDTYITGPGFYQSILMPSGELLMATKNMDLRLIGRGVTIESESVVEQGVFNSGTYDHLTLLNDLITGGEISGPLEVNGNFVVINYITGNGQYLRDVPYRWQKVTENVDVDGITEVHGDVYYTKGNVGIFNNNPDASLEVSGTTNINEVIIGDTLAVSNFVSTTNFTFTNQGAMELDSESGDVIFKRNASQELMKITDSSQWLIGESESDYLFVFRNPEDSELEFKLDSNENSYLDFKTNQKKASIRFDDTGSRYDHNFGANFQNVQIMSEEDIGFFVYDQDSLFIGTDGKVGIFQSNPQNNLDINGNMSIGYASDAAPQDSLIIDGYLSFGTSAINYPLTVIDTVLVGEINTESTGYDGFFHINGDGTYPLYIGSEPIDFSQLLFVSGNISLKEGYLSIRTGASESIIIDRDETSNNQDYIRQNSNTSSFVKFVGNDQLIVRTYDGSAWNDQVIIDDNLFGIGGDPTASYPLMIQDTTVSKVKFQGTQTTELLLQSDDNKVILGTDDKGFHINVDTSIFTNPDLTVIDNKVGINQDSPDDDYDLDVNGITNAHNYFVYDTISEKYEEFETVPSGVIIVWIESTIPDGWALCDGTGTYTDPNGIQRNIPDLQGLFIKSVGDSSNTGDTGGSQMASMSPTTHDHESTSHSHNLGSGAHDHYLTFNSKSLSDSVGNADAFANHFKTGSSHSAALTDSGHHNHDSTSKSHNHGDQTSASNSHNHAASATESHAHEHLDEDGNTAMHGHDFHNEPNASLVKFIIKVDEQL